MGEWIEAVVAANPQLARGLVWCTKCGVRKRVDSEDALTSGWPKHCGYTMTIDSPEERRASSSGGAQKAAL